MCGLTGVVALDPSKDVFEIAKSLLVASEIRGTDSSGLAYFKGKDLMYVKNAVSASKLVPDVSADPTNLIIGHTRQKTKGTEANKENNHPLCFNGFALIHNGMIHNDEEVIKQFQIKLPGEVDSRAILGLIDFFHSAGESIKQPMSESIRQACAQLRGSFAVALIHSKFPNKLWLFRHLSPLELAYDPEERRIYFASTERILEEPFAREESVMEFFTKKTDKARDFYKFTPPDDSGLEITVDPKNKKFEIKAFEIKAMSYEFPSESRAIQHVNNRTSGNSAGSRGVWIAERQEYIPFEDWIEESESSYPHAIERGSKKWHNKNRKGGGNGQPLKIASY